MVTPTPLVSPPGAELHDGVSDAMLAAEAKRLGLGLLVLFGSRARGDAHASSDWDFAALSATNEQLDSVRVALSLVLQTDQLDVADLSRAGALVRHRIAAEGRLLYEAVPGSFLEFQLAATQFWCDIEPVLRRVHSEILQELKAS